MDIYLDIETIPTQRRDIDKMLDDRILAEAQSAKPPAHYKKDEAIRRWVNEQLDKVEHDQNEAYHRTALDGGYGELACICWAIDDGPIRTASRASVAEPETPVLSYLFTDLKVNTRGQAPTFVGFNIPFDLKFLHHRAVILGKRPPLHIPHNDAVWKGSYRDIRYEWFGLRPEKGSKLTDLCLMLGIEVDDEIDGSMVWDRFKAGDAATVVKHCQADVERVRLIDQRLRWRS